MTYSIRARALGQTALVAFLLPLSAMAQDAFELEDINVEAQQDDGTGPVGARVNPATQTGAKTGTPLNEIPQSVSVIGSDTIENQNANKVDSLLAYSAGVQAAPYGYDSDTNWIFVRGFNATATGAFLDGLQNYSYGFGGFYVDPFQLERIEVLRGPSSALYGGSNPGGLVNMVSKTPTGETGGTDTIGVDENGRAWVSTDRQGVLGSGAAWRFLAKAERVDGNGAFDPGSRVLIAPSLSFSTEGGTDVMLNASYTNMDETHVGGAWLPYFGTVRKTTFGRIDRDFNTGEPGYDWYERDQVTLGAKLGRDLGGWRLTNNTRLGWSDVSEGAVYAYSYAPFGSTPQDADNNLARTIFDHKTETKTVLNDVRLENTFNTGATEHRLMFGLDAKYFRLDQVQSAAVWPDAATSLSASDPVYGAAQPGTAPYADNVITQTQFGLYAQDQIRWGDGWIATANLRYDFARTKASEDRTSGAEGSTRKDQELTWRAGLAKEFGNGLTAYGSAATYFNPQVETSAAGDAISPETGRQFETGLKWAPAGGNTFVTLSYFDIERNDILESVWNGAGYDYFQIGEVASEGIELEAQHDFGNGLNLRFAASDMDVTVKNDTNAARIGKTPTTTIEQQAALQLAYTPQTLPGLTVTGGVRWLGSSWADDLNTLKVPSITLVDAGASYEFEGGWKANLAVTNLTDKTYVSGCQTDVNCYYGDGRRLSLAISRSF